MGPALAHIDRPNREPPKHIGRPPRGCLSILYQKYALYIRTVYALGPVHSYSVQDCTTITTHKLHSSIGSRETTYF
jgi:hypothetical protein